MEFMHCKLAQKMAQQSLDKKDEMCFRLFWEMVAGTKLSIA